MRDHGEMVAGPVLCLNNPEHSRSAEEKTHGDHENDPAFRDLPWPMRKRNSCHAECEYYDTCLQAADWGNKIEHDLLFLSGFSPFYS